MRSAPFVSRSTFPWDSAAWAWRDTPAYGLNFDDSVRTANREIALILQIEHKDAVVWGRGHMWRFPELMSILIGPYDLSASIGLLGQTSRASGHRGD